MTDPNAHRIRTRAKTCFGFQCGAAERETRAAERDSVTDHCLQQAEVDRDLTVHLSIEPDVITDCGRTVFYSRYKSEQRFAFAHDGEAHVLAEFGGECGQEGDR